MIFLDSSGVLSLVSPHDRFHDAVSFTLMRDHGVTEALTTDQHFEQEGFVRLLK